MLQICRHLNFNVGIFISGIGEGDVRKVRRIHFRTVLVHAEIIDVVDRLIQFRISGFLHQRFWLYEVELHQQAAIFQICSHFIFAEIPVLRLAKVHVNVFSVRSSGFIQLAGGEIYCIESCNDSFFANALRTDVVCDLKFHANFYGSFELSQILDNGDLDFLCRAYDLSQLIFHTLTDHGILDTEDLVDLCGFSTVQIGKSNICGNLFSKIVCGKCMEIPLPYIALQFCFLRCTGEDLKSLCQHILLPAVIDQFLRLRQDHAAEIRCVQIFHGDMPIIQFFDCISFSVVSDHVTNFQTKL